MTYRPAALLRTRLHRSQRLARYRDLLDTYQRTVRTLYAEVMSLEARLSSLLEQCKVHEYELQRVLGADEVETSLGAADRVVAERDAALGAWLALRGGR